MMGILIAAAGFVVLVFGVVTILTSFMPTFGGSRNDGTGQGVLGLALMAIGCGLIFYGGTWQ